MTGGAGYIGAHIVREFLAADIPVTVLDDLSTGELGFLPGKVSFTRGTILDGSLLERVFDEHDVSGVVHVAGFKYAGVSVQRPLFTYEQNVDGTTVLLAAMQDRGVQQMVFSSSAAVYGTPDVDLVTEATPTVPQSPYGESKLIGEWLLAEEIPEGAGTVVHGDYRLDNVLIGPGLEINAVLDWEMSTLGDPLSDVALTLVYAGRPLLTGNRTSTSVPGHPSLVEMADHYAKRSGRDVSDLHWYVGFAAFKLAVILEGVHYRYVQGQTVGEGFDTVGAMVAPLVRQGHESLDGSLEGN